MGCAVHACAGPTPTTFSAATDTLSKLEGTLLLKRLNVLLHLPSLHATMFTFSVATKDPD